MWIFTEAMMLLVFTYWIYKNILYKTPNFFITVVFMIGFFLIPPPVQAMMFAIFIVSFTIKTINKTLK